MKIPAGKSTVTPYIVAKGADRFLDFVEEVFGVKASARIRNEDGTIGHAEITVGDSVLMAFDSADDWPPTPAFLSVYVPDVDETFERAKAAGASVVTEPMYSRIIGDRACRVKDPVGNIWWLLTHVEEADPAKFGELFADPQEAALMRHAQETFAAAMRS